MARSIDRRSFLRRAGTAAVAAMGAPVVRPARATAGPNERLVVAVGQWGTETPFAWRGVQGEKPLWDCVYDSLITRDPKTFEYRPGLATEWKPSNELKTWTFKLRSGVKCYYGVMLGVKSVTWALSKKVGGWQSLAYVPLETNYEYVSPAG
ncbi:MAG: hypothetical protein DME07_11850 [Candidatus Rokuibacteriota bacterium]|nr:MAG: hypothetical protein DME07_11850 [Candidatus Rokubacteria bacterium]PYN53479.1 MAG: hypothetical protein DMD94_18615 [Candidatus Rokubacteria bacterium]